MSCFPVDVETLRYLRETGRSDTHVDLVERYARAQGLWWTADDPPPLYSEVLTLDLATVKPSVSGPRFPHARIDLDAVPGAFRAGLPRRAGDEPRRAAAPAAPTDGALAIAAITSCTNTSNPGAMLAAGLVARNAVARGLAPPAWVKTSLSPGSRMVGDYLARAGLLAPLEALGFHVVGHGCMTCVGFSGPLLPGAEAAERGGVRLAAVLSGNRNYDGRVHADVHASFLASPPLVVAWALAGTVARDLTREPVSHDPSGCPVFLADLWPDADELRTLMARVASPARYRERYAAILDGPAGWRALPVQPGPRFAWPASSTVLRRPPPTEDPTARPIRDAALLALFGDQVTTEHISPMGPIPADCDAARCLEASGVPRAQHGTYAGRRLNHDVMLRGTFTAPHLVNRLVPEHPGGWTRHHPSGERMTIHAAAERYRSEGRALVVVAGRDYGTGSSRDWSAKGPRGLGVRAIIAESFERIHRANLVAAGVLPLALPSGMRADALALDGTESIDLAGVDAIAAPLAPIACTIRRSDTDIARIELTAMLETAYEVGLYRSGGLLPRLLSMALRGAEPRVADGS